MNHTGFTDEDLTYINRCKQDITKNNESLIENITKMGNDKTRILNSIEFFKVVTSIMFLEDIYFLMSVSGSFSYTERQGDTLIRGMIEHVIESLYYYKRPEEIDDYMGMRTDKPDMTNSGSIEDYKKFTSKRFESNKKSVAKMADAIEPRSTEISSLYGMYSYFSENHHNAYYLQMLDDIRTGDFEKRTVGLSEAQSRTVLLLLTNFMAGYMNDEIKKNR